MAQFVANRCHTPLTPESQSVDSPTRNRAHRLLRRFSDRMRSATYRAPIRRCIVSPCKTSGSRTRNDPEIPRFEPHPWCRGADAQTIAGRYLNPRGSTSGFGQPRCRRRLRRPTPDSEVGPANLEERSPGRLARSRPGQLRSALPTWFVSLADCSGWKSSWSG